MPRRLSDPEYAAFMSEINPGLIEGIPAWGAVVNWNGMWVLMYNRPDGGWELTDVSTMTAWRSSFVPFDNIADRYAVYHFPAEFLARVQEVLPKLPEYGSEILVVGLLIAAAILIKN